MIIVIMMSPVAPQCLQRAEPKAAESADPGGRQAPRERTIATIQYQ